MKELITVYGTVTGTGAYSLASDLFYKAVPYIRIPKGLKAKVWCKRIAGEAADVNVEFAQDVTAAEPRWVAVETQRLASPGEVALEKRKPLIIRGRTGREAIRVNRTSGTGVSYVALEIEIGDED